MIAGVAWMVVANAGVLLAARAATARLSTGRTDVDAAVFVFLRVAFVMASVLAAGVMGLLRPHVLGLAWLAVGAILVARGAHRGLSFRIPAPPDASRLVRLLILLLAARAVLQIWFFFPFSTDALSYHLPKVAHWVRDGAIGLNMGPDARGWMPAAFELLETWWCVFLHHDVLIEAAGVEMHLLGVLSIYALARSMGITPRHAAYAAVALALVPGMVFQAVGTMNDGPVAAMYTFTAALIAANAHPALLLSAAAVAIGIKATYAYLAPGLLLLVWFHRKGIRAARMPRAAAAGLLALCLPLGGYWFARNAVVHGNPIHPLGRSGVKGITGANLQQVGPSLDSLRQNAAELADMRVYDHRRAYEPLLQFGTGWGPVVFACGIPLLAAAAFWSAGFRRVGAAYAVSLAAVLSLVIPDPFTGRFYLFFTGLPLLALAFGLDRVRVLQLPAGAAVMVSFAVTLVPQGLQVPILSEAIVNHGWRERWIGWSHYDGLPPGKTACMGGERLYGSCAYALFGPDFRRDVLYVRSGTPEGILDELRRGGAASISLMNLGTETSEIKALLRLKNEKKLVVRNAAVLEVPPAKWPSPGSP